MVGDEILLAVGRTPNVEGLNLEAAGVQYDDKGVTVDDHLRTSNKNILAAGDIGSRFHFTHAAEALGRIALQNALFFGRKRASDLVIPWCTYTNPEIAHVGLNEEEARKSGIEMETFTLPFAENDRGVVDGDTVGIRARPREQEKRQGAGRDAGQPPCRREHRRTGNGHSARDKGWSAGRRGPSLSHGSGNHQAAGRCLTARQAETMDEANAGKNVSVAALDNFSWSCPRKEIPRRLKPKSIWALSQA